MLTRKPFLKVLGVLLSAVLLMSLAVACAEGTPSATASTGAATAPAGAPAATAAPAAATEAAPQVIKIGYLSPLTGTNATYGNQSLWAAQMIADLINNDSPDYAMALAKGTGLPNLNGAQIQLVPADYKGDATVAVAEAKRLINEEKVVALTGQFTSAITKAVAVVTEQYQIPLLTAGSAVTLTDGSTPLKWYFRFGPNDATYIKDTFAFLDQLNKTKNAGLKTVGCLSEDTEFGANIRKQEEIFAAQYGFTIVQDITYPSNSTNLTAECLKMKEANPDVLVEASYASDAILFTKTMKEQNWAPKLLIGQRGGFVQTDFLDAVGSLKEDYLTTGGWSADLSGDVTAQLVKLYPEKYSKGVALTEGHCKDMTNVLFIALAINQAGSTDSAKIAEALRNLKVDVKTLILPTGAGITMDQYGQNTSASGVILQMQNNKYATVYPDSVKAADIVFPMPSWADKK